MQEGLSSESVDPSKVVSVFVSAVRHALADVVFIRKVLLDTYMHSTRKTGWQPLLMRFMELHTEDELIQRSDLEALACDWITHNNVMLDLLDLEMNAQIYSGWLTESKILHHKNGK
jgi:hypothetical protein